MPAVSGTLNCPGDAMKNVAEEFPFDERWDGTSGRRRLRDHPRRARREACGNEGRPGRSWGAVAGRPRGLASTSQALNVPPPPANTAPSALIVTQPSPRSCANDGAAARFG